jgi:CCR4-NOT transcriptional regulation complex NOT5 subunit
MLRSFTEDDQKQVVALRTNRRLINAKLHTGKSVKKTELTGRSPSRRRKSTLDCSGIEKEEEEK